MKYSNLVILLFITIVITDGAAFTIPINPPVVLYSLMYMCMFILIFLALQSTEFTNLPDSGKTLFKLFWLHALIIIVYSLFVAHTYWDYKFIFINHLASVIITFCIFIGLKLELNLNLFKFIIKILFPLGLFLSYFVWSSYPNLIARPLVPIFFFILAFPFLKLKHQWLVLAISILCILILLDWRANIFRIIGCWTIVLLYYLSLLKHRLKNLIFALIVSIPFLSIFLGIQGTLDIFQFATESNVEVMLDKSNTRTLLYQEIYWTIKESVTRFIFGGSAVGGYISPLSNLPGLNLVTDKGRYGSEVAFLNTLIKTGIIGVIFDILIFFIPAYFAINQSNNNFSKILGFYLALSWLLYFVGTPVQINLNNFFSYFIIGLCLSPSLRNSTDAEIKFFFKSI